MRYVRRTCVRREAVLGRILALRHPRDERVEARLKTSKTKRRPARDDAPRLEDRSCSSRGQMLDHPERRVIKSYLAPRSNPHVVLHELDAPLSFRDSALASVLSRRFP